MEPNEFEPRYNLSRLVEIARGVMEEMLFEVYISVALATILCTEVKLFVQFL